MYVLTTDIPVAQQTISKIFHDLVSCDESSGHVTSHGQLLDALVERAGRDDVETKLLSLQTLEQLAKRRPEVVLDRVSVFL